MPVLLSVVRTLSQYCGQWAFINGRFSIDCSVRVVRRAVTDQDTGCLLEHSVRPIAATSASWVSYASLEM